MMLKYRKRTLVLYGGGKLSIVLYGDESGSITLSNQQHLKYFYIGMISTQQKDKVKRVFRKAKAKYIKANQVHLNIKSEIKGSEMSEAMKRYIFDQLIEKTDICFYCLVVDNTHLRKVLREKPNVTYNYLVGVMMKEYFKHHHTHLHLILDNRNTKVTHLKDLEHYLGTLLLAETDIQNVTVNYVDSKMCDLVQVADVFCNLLYRYGSLQLCQDQGKGEKKYKKNAEILCAMQDRIKYVCIFPKEKNKFHLPFQM